MPANHDSVELRLTSEEAVRESQRLLQADDAWQAWRDLDALRRQQEILQRELIGQRALLDRLEKVVGELEFKTSGRFPLRPP